MNKQELFTYLTKNVSGYTVREMALNLSVIFVASLFIFLVYKLTTKRVNYYSNFAIVIMLTSVVTGVIMMIIESNLALSLGMVGALSIIRFRSAIKDPVDTSYIFWAVAVGISSGTGNHVLTFVSGLLIAVFVVIFSFLNLSRTKELLVLHGESVTLESVQDVLRQSHVRYAVKSKTASAAEREFIFEISCRTSDALLEKLSALPGVQSVNIASGVNI